MTNLDENIIDVPNPDGRGSRYRHFGVAKKLLDVKELFVNPPKLWKWRTLYEIYKRIDVSYYGYHDKENGVLERLERLTAEDGDNTVKKKGKGKRK